MCRRLLMSLTLLGVLVPSSAQAKEPVDGRLATCAEAERVAVFEGDIRRVKGAMRLQVRFTLQARTPMSKRWAVVKAPGFGTWNTSAPGVRRYVYAKRVENLVGPGSYRVRVDFRWQDVAGRTLDRARRITPPCRVADPRAELLATGLEVLLGLMDPSRRRYEVHLRNDGRSATGAFALELTVDGVVQPPAEVASLPAGERRTVSLDGPACTPGSEVLVELDANDAVAERDEGNNVVTAACPAAR